MSKKLYRGELNEFIDWDNGINSITQDSILEDDEIISGESIRKLIQKKLKTPFIVKTVGNQYKMFPSEEAYNLWMEDVDKSNSDIQDLEMLSFDRPTEYNLYFNGISTQEKRYIKVGNSNDSNGRISFSWYIINGKGVASNEKIQITYTILNNTDNTRTSFTRVYNPGLDSDVDFSIYNYLKEGLNTISIEGIGETSGATNNIMFYITLLDLNISTNFDFCKIQLEEQTYIKTVFERNDPSGNAIIHYIIDKTANSSGTEITETVGPTPGITTTTINNFLNFSGLSEGIHSLQIYAEASYNEGRTKMNSNLLYYTFISYNRNETLNNSITKYTPIQASFNNGDFPLPMLILSTTQFDNFSLKWGYNSISNNIGNSDIEWRLYRDIDDNNPILLTPNPINASVGQTYNLNYSFDLYSEYNEDSTPKTFIVAVNNKNENQLSGSRIPIQIFQNQEFTITETKNEVFNLSAKGKSNESSTKDVWEDGSVSTQFVNIAWNTNSGWYENSFRTCGINEYAEINYNPFRQYNIANAGKTIEIEFETEKVDSDNDVLVRIGSSTGQTRIEITPVKATLYSNNTAVVYTNYKANERQRITFIINSNPVTDKTIDSGLVYIVNNGILERAADGSSYSYYTGSVDSAGGSIKIGGSNSGIKVFNIKVYNYALTYMQAYNNWVFNSDNKLNIFERNNIIDNQGNISYDACCNIIDTILIEGDISELLAGLKTKSSATVNISRVCPFDKSKNFTVSEALIRKHGQSTLEYPIPSFKIWLNKSGGNQTPSLDIETGYSKNRYRMKDDSIPCNKFVLQANYADSSGVHNGGIERLIQETWYNAKINDKYLLRTEPQLFTSISPEDKSKYGLDHVWGDYVNSEFPYELRVAPDSFPCVVFYTNGNTTTFLGQYVFMDDKKSDFLYGERSIYRIPGDPFCMKVNNSKKDTAENKIWDNGNVIRIEGSTINTTISSYMNDFDNGNYITDRIDVIDSNTQEITEQRFKWEEDFELIYPDPDDIEEDDQKKGLTKFKGSYKQSGDSDFAPNTSKFIKKTQPFIDFIRWLVSTKNKYNQTTEWWTAGQYSSFNEAFQATAADHLDLYKMAAYYIFCIRFGLVDSMERNAQIKTYDGQHWHYEPWDMDIALGNKNDGGIAFDPPINRNTKLGEQTHAFSGRTSTITGEIITSNTLWDGLENWGYWIGNIVPNVARALYSATDKNGKKVGLTYNNVINMLEGNYSNYWGEIIYNKSGYFKYIQSKKSNRELSWLQGARTTHRHWWLSTSMDYYDAKWNCGSFREYYISIKALVKNGNMIFTPNKQTSISIEKEGSTFQPLVNPSPNNPLNFDISTIGGIDVKVPTYIYGANYIESIDISSIAWALESFILEHIYSDVLGSPLKNLIIGTLNGNLNKTGTPSQIRIPAHQVNKNASSILVGVKDSFSNLRLLNIRGLVDFDTLIMNYNYNISSLENVYAAGSGLKVFYSSADGNTFDNIELPSSIETIKLYNSTWNNLEFWKIYDEETVSTEIETTDDNGNIITTTQSYQNAKLSLYNDNGLTVPYTLKRIDLMGSTTSSLESMLFIKEWIRSIEYAVTNVEGYQYSDYTIVADNLNWNWNIANENNNNLLTFEELMIISKINHNIDEGFKGYILLQGRNEGNELSSTELAQIREAFGNRAFMKNNGALTVDYYQVNYLQINISGGKVENGQIIINENETAQLSATHFLLGDGVDPEDPNYVSPETWFVGDSSIDPQNITKYSIKGGKVYISQANDNDDKVAKLIIDETPSGTNYPIYLKCRYQDQGEAIYKTTSLLVKGVTYPNINANYFDIRSSKDQGYSGKIYLERKENGRSPVPIILDDGIEFNKGNMDVSLLLHYDEFKSDFTATISSISIQFKLKNGQNCINYIKNFNLDTEITTINPNINLSDSYNLNLTFKSTNNYIESKFVTSEQLITDMSEQFEIIYEISYKSGKKINRTYSILVYDDSIPIVSTGGILYNVITTTYPSLSTKSDLYKSDLLSLGENETNSNYKTLTFSDSSLNSLTGTGSGENILKYLPNIRGLDFSNRTLIPASQFSFGNNTKLKKLYLNGCNQLNPTYGNATNKAIDLSSNTQLVDLRCEGTTVNVTLPTTGTLTTLKLGSPYKINIDGSKQTNLTYDNISLQNNTNLTELELYNIKNNKTFSLFEQIINSTPSS